MDWQKWVFERTENFLKRKVGFVHKAREEIHLLTDKILYLNKKYYIQNNSEVTDFLYDSLIYLLRQWEKEFPKLIRENSPTCSLKNISSATKRISINHSSSMISIDNVFNKNELQKFTERVYKKINYKNIEFIIEPKLDGLSLAIYYENGKLVKALTRGNGIVGEDVLDSVLLMDNIPKKINYKKNIEIRGEVFLTTENYLKIKKIRKKEIASSRNIASGLLRSFKYNPNDFIFKKYLSFFAYQIIDPYLYSLKTQEQVLKKLKELRFGTSSRIFVSSDVKKLISFYNSINNDYQKNKINFALDGMVIKVNDFKYYKMLGSTNKFPRWAIAYKFPEELKETQITDLEISVGRTGRVNCIGIIKPVIIDNTIIQRVTLNNPKFIDKKDIRKNDYIIIKKSGGIIPKFLKIVKEKRNKNPKFKISSNCIVCYSALKYIGQLAFCINKNCDAIKVSKIIYFCSNKILDIVGLGTKIIKQLYKHEYLKNITDIYKLKNRREEIINEIFDGKRITALIIDKILGEVENSKNKNYEKILVGLSIPYVGKANVDLITNNFNTIEKLEKTTVAELEKIDGIGPKVASAIFNFLKNKENINIINYLKKQGLCFEKIGNSKNKMIFFVTGTLPIKRKELEQLINSKQSILKKTYSKNINYFIKGKKPSENKISKAKNDKLKIINYTKFKKIINSTN